MFTSHKKFGIGEVVENNGTMVTSYYSEIDENKSTLLSITKIYATEEAAELALNPEFTEEELNARIADLEEEKRIMRVGAIAMANIEITNRKASTNLMKNI